MAGLPGKPADYPGMKPKQAGFDLFKGNMHAAIASFWNYDYQVQDDKTPPDQWRTEPMPTKSLPGIAPTNYGPVVKVADTIEWLRGQGHVYEGRLPPPKSGAVEDWEDREQTLFRSTAFGDDVDRPLKKSDGSYTYFATDIAYHKTKLDRGFAHLIDVWGADHGGYVKRMQAAVKALSGGKADIDVKLVQIVKLLREGEPVKMSKRAGDFITLREVVDEVGKRAVRFDMLYRKHDAPLDFDLA
jgi:arginyl-tRNA synthetase